MSVTITSDKSEIEEYVTGTLPVTPQKNVNSPGTQVGGSHFFTPKGRSEFDTTERVLIEDTTEAGKALIEMVKNSDINRIIFFIFYTELFY